MTRLSKRDVLNQIYGEDIWDEETWDDYYWEKYWADVKKKREEEDKYYADLKKKREEEEAAKNMS